MLACPKRQNEQIVVVMKTNRGGRDIRTSAQQMQGHKEDRATEMQVLYPRRDRVGMQQLRCY